MSKKPREKAKQKAEAGSGPLTKNPAISARDLRFALLLLAAIFIAYFPALNGQLLWDDDAHVTKPVLQSLDGLRRIWFDLGATQQYYPLLHTAFWIEHRMWGSAPLGYHLTNLALHTVAALLVVALARRLTLPGAWLAGFVFALHPVAAEAVAWISEQKSTLSTVFYLASALAYLKFDRSRRGTNYALAFTLFLCALASKTVTATLPAALLVIFWWQRGRIEAKRDVVRLLPFFAIGAAAGVFTAWVERTYIGAQGSDFALTPISRFLLAGRVICFYFAKLILPVNLIFFYPHWTIDASVWWQWLFPAAVLTAAAVAIVYARSNRGPLAALLFFTGTLFPVLGFLNVYPFVYSWVADHFAYLASLGVIVPACALLTIAARRAHLDSRTLAATSAALTAILAILTFRESRIYTNVETLYASTLARNPDSWISHNNLGTWLLKTPARIPEAEAHFNTALRLKPNSAEALNNLGSAYSKTNRLPEAIEKYEAALRIRPKFAEAEDNLGAALAKLPGRSNEALPHLEAAVRMKPDYAQAHNNLGVTLSNIPGRMPDAIAEYETALRLDPDMMEAHNNLASALAETPGRASDAISEYERALRANPQSAEAHSNLGSVLSEAGRYPEAIDQLNAALKINPNSAEAHNSLGAALAKTPGRTNDAVAEYETALRLDPHLGEAHNNLGSVYAQSGRMKEALVEFEAAVRDRPNSAEARMNLANVLSDIPGRAAEAAANYEFVVRAKPEFAEGHYFLGLALAKLGRRDDAIAQFEAALRIKPDAEVQELVDRLRRAGPAGAR